MKTILLALMMLPCVAFGQHKLPPPPSRPPTAAEIKMEKEHYHCLHRNLYTINQRKNIYPFNNYKTVKLISFNDPEAYINLLPVDHHILDKTRIKEIKTLTTAGIDSLTDILYNIGYTPVKPRYMDIADPGVKCFNPRNAVLFMDKNGNAAEYIELCFECQKIILVPAE